ncbi:MAG: hypothetical protein QM780_06165 [Hyphomicrobium sp.]|uniref:hypothetical protein n=1 Tax=Hyphomicrobium sp. TaxID=82 RepID=UPI0039E6C826
MSRNGLSPVGLDKLEAALDTYGADRTRWPAPLRLALSGLIAGNPDAQKMLKDAEAFDRLLDTAPQYDVARLDKLSDRIAAAAERQPRLVATGAGQAKKSGSVWSSIRRHHGVAATALAASLVLGVFAGQLNMFNTTADALLDGNSSKSSVGRQVALTDDGDSFLDEDLL